MIGKISMSSSFRSCISYCLEDKRLKESQEVVFKNRAEPIAYNQCFGKKNKLIEQFNDVRALNRKVQKPVLHFMLSFAHEDKLDRGKLTEMAVNAQKKWVSTCFVFSPLAVLIVAVGALSFLSSVVRNLLHFLLFSPPVYP